MALSIHLCKGIKHPKSFLFAALTIASAFIKVISPLYKAILSLLKDKLFISTIFLVFNISCKTLS